MNHKNLPLFNKYSFCEKFKVTSDPSAFSAINYFECGALVPVHGIPLWRWLARPRARVRGYG